MIPVDPAAARDLLAGAKRVIVTGGRTFVDMGMVQRVLACVNPYAVIVHGAAPGADSLAAGVWTSWGRGALVEPHPARWSAPCRDTCKPGHRVNRGRGEYCPSAGHHRNQEMADAGADACLVFPGGNGTADMVRRARTAEITAILAGTL